MHIDLNSCFASVEQQANPLLRGVPVAVAASAKPYGCILAPSVEAKLYGIKTGMTVAEGRSLCPFLVVRELDPPKYRQIHAQIGQLLREYSPHVVSKSIDEYCLVLPVPKGTILERNPWLQAKDSPHGAHRVHKYSRNASRNEVIWEANGEGQSPTEIEAIARDIKSRIKAEIGDYLRVSIGVSTNQILAKLASGLHKPDGYDVIDSTNYWDIYSQITLQDFCGINVRNEARLHRVGIATAREFATASVQTLKAAFESTLGRYWYLRLRGYEIDDIVFARRSCGQSYVLPHPMTLTEWRPILVKLVSKAARRLRQAGYQAGTIHLALRFADHTHWHQGQTLGGTLLFDDKDLVQAMLALYRGAPLLPVKKIAVTVAGITRGESQLSLLSDLSRQKKLVTALDKLNDKWGEYTVTYGSLLGSAGHVKDAIAFGK
jgi:DNA polymerase-4